MNGQLPKLLQIDERASRNVVRRAPLIDGLFRPEEEHGGSRKNEIVPPMRRWHSEMRDVRSQNRLAVFHLERQRFASVSIRRRPKRNSRNSASHPLQLESWSARPKMANSMRIVGFRKEKTLGMQAPESGEDSVFFYVNLM